jgi:multiple sugar transport system substrate-binding protein
VSKTVQIPDAWATAWHWFYDAIWKDHISVTGQQFLNTDFNPEGYPFFTGKVAMSENYLWSTYGVAGAGDDWDMAATPSYDGQTTAAQRRYLPHPQVEQRTRRGVQGPDLPARLNTDLLSLYGGMPAVESEQDAFCRASRRRTPSPSTGMSPRKASPSPTSPTSIVHAGGNQTLDLLNTFGTEVAGHLDLTSTLRSHLKTQMQAIWDQGGN